MQRELNEIEYFNWCIGQPYNMVVVVGLQGDLSIDGLRNALAMAQRRHPLLKVNTEIGPAGIPIFSSDAVGDIPLSVVRDAGRDEAQRLAERELGGTFEMDQAGANRLPLIRATLFLPRDASEPIHLVFVVQHIIADGLSMVFLVRDLLHFIDEPDAPFETLDAPAVDADLFAPSVRRTIPKSSWQFDVALRLAKLYALLRYGPGDAPRKAVTPFHCAWELSADQTARLRDRCRREGVSVHAAICAALTPGFSAIHTPVNLRGRLGRPVGEAVGLFVGAAEVAMKYRPRRGFWANARAFHRRLRKALRNPFTMFRLFSKSVPPERVRQLGTLMMKFAGQGRAFGVTNLAQLDAGGVVLRSRHLKIDSFFGAVSGIVDASVLTVYTIEGKMHLRVLANESSPTDTSVRDDVNRAVALLVSAIDG